MDILGFQRVNIKSGRYYVKHITYTEAESRVTLRVNVHVSVRYFVVIVSLLRNTAVCFICFKNQIKNQGDETEVLERISQSL